MKASLELNSRENKNGFFDILVRIQNGNQKTRKKTPYGVSNRKYFDSQKFGSWVSNKESNYAAINKNLKILLENYTNQIAEGLNENAHLDTKTVVFSANAGSTKTSLVSFLEEKISLMMNYNHRKGYQQTLNHWLNYAKEKRLGDLSFTQINTNILKGFENYLVKKGNASSSCYTNLKRIRACFNMAITEKIIGVGDYIFRGYKMPSAKSVGKKEKLTAEEMKSFMDVQYEDGTLTKTVQQCFLLQFHLAGVRIEDVLTLEWTNVRKDRIFYSMVKNSKGNSFQITPQIRKILDYFRSIRDDKNPLVVPVLEPEFLAFKSSGDEKENELYKKRISSKTALINKYLRIIATDAEIEKHVSTHVSRHSFASIAAKRTNGNLLFVQRALNHSSPTITKAYLESLDDESLDEGMADVTKL
jgi:integrase/recombinase XerD